MDRTTSQIFIASFFILFWLLPSQAAVDHPWSLEIDAGWVIPGYNDVQVPNPGGTRFSLSDDLGIDEKPFYRMRLSWRPGRRHGLSLLFAPLTLRASGVLQQPVSFAEVLFPEGTGVEALYRFNSYRFTYRYLLVDRQRFELWLGLTAKIRDAEIALEGDGLASNTTDLGFVPLLNLLVRWSWTDRLGLLLEADAAAASQGRAEDVALSLFYSLSPTVKLRAGYRLVEGGADVEQVYNFAMINYLFAGITLSW